MLLPSAVLLRRKTPYVVKYLEGVPVPTKVIDHIAGADLSSSTAIDFFTTVPRYVNTTQEQRLSKLFFHHVLYGAGGARGPTQVVVVRNGRTVVPSTILQLTSQSGSTNANKEKKAKDIAGQRYRSKDPMAVPLSQRGACSPAQHSTKKKNILVAEEKEDDMWRSAEGNITPLTSTAVIHSAPAAAWSRVDAARRPYFYIPRLSSTRSAHQTGNSLAEVYAGRYTMATPRVSTWHAPHIAPRQPQEDRLHSVLHGGTEASDTMNTLKNGMKHALHNPLQHEEEERKSIAARPTQDSALTALCGVIQGAFAERTTGEVVDLLAQLAVNESAGILNSHYSSHSQSNTTSELQHDAAEKTKEETRRTRINGILRHAAQQRTTSATNTHAYLQVHLPPAAITVMPLPNNTTENSEEKESEATSSWLCRLAGGVEPRVTFAVGTPLTTSPSNAAPFAHLTCLVRVNMHRTNSTRAPTRAMTESHTTTTTTQVSVQQQQNKSSVSDSGNNPCDAVTEPWRLGDALDPALPTRTRTLVERIAQEERNVAQEEANNENISYKLLLGRTDAETYLLPQRELLVTVYVPRETVTRVAEQNAERVRRQTQARQQDNALPAMDVAWPSATRLTAERGWHGQLSNLRTAEGTSATDVSENNNTAEETNSKGVAVSPSLHHYEIRALPGDVLYIPRGWQYRMRCIIGTALLEPSNRRNDSSSTNLQSVRPEAVRRLCANTALGLDESARRSVTRTSQTQQSSITSSSSVSTQEDEYVIDDIEVDALCLMYQPYPLLTKDQARVYVAANYVQGGIEAFYRNGGNDVYYPYE